uniref:Uncharacterized protein n=1 Tax=Anopheles farauti TaxID=69004 RepID=A0A182QVF4_9DIPT
MQVPPAGCVLPKYADDTILRGLRLTSRFFERRKGGQQSGTGPRGLCNGRLVRLEFTRELSNRASSDRQLTVCAAESSFSTRKKKNKPHENLGGSAGVGSIDGVLTVVLLAVVQ